MLLFEKIFLVWKILCKCQKNKTKKNQRYQKLNIFPYQSKRAVFGKNFVRCDDRLKHKHELKHLLKTLDSKNVSRKNYTHTGECSCVSRIQGGGGGWEGGVSYTDLVGIGLGVEDDLVSHLLLLFLQLRDCWFILVFWFRCSGLRWIRLLTSFPLSLFFLSLLFMLLFLLRFILAVFSFRFFSLGFLRTERERERRKNISY